MLVALGRIRNPLTINNVLEVQDEDGEKPSPRLGAGLVAVAGAQAADLPVKAKPVQYVKICTLYGAGFYYMPGTDTCMKIGGWVRSAVGLRRQRQHVVRRAGWQHE